MNLTRLRGVHFTFAVLYGVATMLYAVAIIALINLESIFIVLPAGLALIPGAMIYMLQMEESGLARSEKMKLGCALVFAGVFLVFGWINPVIYMSSECPNLAPASTASISGMRTASNPAGGAGPDRTHGAGDTITTHNNNMLDLLVRYDEWDALGKEKTEYALMLKYNVTHSRIERRAWRPDKKSWQQVQLQVHALAMEPVCTTQLHTRFYFMEDEVREALADRRAATEARKSLTVKTGHDSTTAQSLEDEEIFDDQRKTRRICRHEYSYLILFLVYLSALFVLVLVSLLFYMMAVETKSEAPEPSEKQPVSQ
jgi:hypothetical protein